MEIKMWRPSLTSQFLICPVPFHLDTYRGCAYDCAYCFARDFITFSRRNSEHKESTYIVANDPTSFNKWITRVQKQTEYDYTKGAEVAIKERIPLKIGANADPCPPIESSKHITKHFLEILKYYDYPTEIQTKNPQVLAEILSTMTSDINLTIAVTLISTDEGFVKVCEPNAPSAQSRLDAIKKLADRGFKVMVKIQPAIYPTILSDLPALIGRVADAGCWAVNIEGLKIRISMPAKEQILFQTIGDYIKIDLRELYRTGGEKTGSDWEMNKAKKLEYINFAIALCKDNKIKCFIADNHMGETGDGCECCGTQALHNYKIWGNNARTRGFGRLGYESQELGKCVVNFTRSYDSKKPQTMDEMAQKYMPPAWAEEAQEMHKENEELTKSLGEKTIVSMIHASFPGETREYFETSPTLSTACGGGHLPYVKRATKGKAYEGGHAKVHEGEDVCQTLEAGVSGGGGVSNRPVISGESAGGVIRRLTPVEYERLQGFPASEESVVITLYKNNYADQIKNDVSVGTPRLNMLKYAGSVESAEFGENVVSVGQVSSLKNQQTTELVHPNVLISCGEGTVEIHNQGKSKSPVLIVGQQGNCLLPIAIEDFALIIAGINLIAGLIVGYGKGELHQSELCSVLQKNGERLVKLSGSGTMQLVECVEKSLTTPRKHFKFITLKYSDINTLEQELLTLFSYVCIAIDGYIPEEILIENILVIKMTTIHGYSKYGLNRDGKLRPISDTQRYKCLGNAVSVPVVREVAKRLLKDILEHEE